MKRLPGRVSVVFSDVHAPKQDPMAWACFLDAVRKIRESMNLIGAICLGDLVDLASITHHEKSPDDAGLTLAAELKAGGSCLDQVAKAAGADVEKVLVQGNHEYRLDRYLASGECPRALLDVVPHNVFTGLKLQKRGWRYIGRDRQPYRHRGVLVHHGYWYPKHHAAKHADELGADNIYGHTHRPQQHTRTNVGGSVTSTGLPCLRILERDWEHMKTRPFAGWTHGFGIMCHDADRTSVYNVLIEKGRAAWGGLTFKA